MKFYIRNYIILNGNISTNIGGLLIQELPPITKPKIRTEIEEIDGRDGDIVTTLGYSAYDKEFSIGLYGDFNIDEVISYFDSEGIVVFSNEEDKYYKYQIIEQIDFERLVRFRTATVKMHVQPFKYSITDNKKIFEIDEETSISIRNAGNVYSKPKMTIYGTGQITISLNGKSIFSLDIGNYRYMTIDTCLMEAFCSNTLLNRLISGDYNNFRLAIGKNTISWTGNVTKIEIEDFSRWI